MRNLLVTGGAGFIGANFAHYMHEILPGLRIIVLDKLAYAGNLENLKGLDEGPCFSFVRGDITDFEAIDSLFGREKIDTVVNFAAESHVDRSILGPRAFMETNIMGTFTLLEAARKHWIEGKTVKSEDTMFLHVSTDEVYGSLSETGYFTEETPYSPNSPYSASKASSDHIVRAYHHTYGIRAVTTNCSNNYGPYQFPEKLIPLMIINALNGRPLPVYGDGGNVRDWLHVSDHCRAIDTALQKGRPGQTYNIGGGNEKKNIEIVELICSTIDEMSLDDGGLRKLYPFKGPRKGLIRFIKDRPGHDRRYAVDFGKMEAELGWRPEVAFEDGIRKTVEWYINNRAWWERIISGEYIAYYEHQYGGR